MKKKKMRKLLQREQQRADVLKQNLKQTREKLGRVSELRNRLETKLREDELAGVCSDVIRALDPSYKGDIPGWFRDRLMIAERLSTALTNLIKD